MSNEEKAKELQEKMGDTNFELDIDALEDAAGGEYRYIDTCDDDYY